MKSKEDIVRSRKKSRRGKRNYTIGYLLYRQPKWVKRHEYYGVMLVQFRSSERLKYLRFNRKCYSLLQHAKIKPENLKFFYRAYRLPRDPFFPLFLKIRREYLENRERRRREKQRYIKKKMEELPKNVYQFMSFLRELEQQINGFQGHPVWTASFLPKTKKQVHQYLDFDINDWTRFIKNFLPGLSSRYRRISNNTTDRLLSCFILGALPRHNHVDISEKYAILYPDRQTITRQYRILSKQYHPDIGGSSEQFVYLKWARDLLLSYGSRSAVRQ